MISIENKKKLNNL